MSHARHMAALAVACPVCPAKVGWDCINRSGFHKPRSKLVETLADRVRDQMVEHVATLRRLRRQSGGVDGAGAAAVLAAIAGLVNSDRSPAGV